MKKEELTERPIRPDEVMQKFPYYVIGGFNICIENYWEERAQRSKFTKDTVIKEIIKQYFGVGDPCEANVKSFVEMLEKNHYLEVDHLYETAGWKVEYNKPCWDERWEPHFIFTKNEYFNGKE